MGKKYYRKNKSNKGSEGFLFIFILICLFFVYRDFAIAMIVSGFSLWLIKYLIGHGIKAIKDRRARQLAMRLQEEQQARQLQAQQEAERSYKDFIRRVSEVYVSNDREEYVIKKEDYKRGNNRENEYRKKYLLPLLSLYNNKCAKCGKMDNGFDLDHFFLSKNEGGNFSLFHKDGYLVNNAIPLCQSCNRSKGDRPYNHFFEKEQIITLFTKNKEMTLLLNRASVNKGLNGIAGDGETHGLT